MKHLRLFIHTVDNLELDELSSSALQIVFNKVSITSKDPSKAEGAKAASAYKPQPEKFESTSALQMKYEDLKRSSDQELSRLNNHIKALMEKLLGAKDQKKSEKGQKYIVIN